ncbi:unnamed protein product [Trichobilharzia szidati]|nr:unnamed protein product [Trichobilharzia szidati]
MPMKRMSYPVIVIFILHLSTIKSKQGGNSSSVEQPPTNQTTKERNTTGMTDEISTPSTNYSSSTDAFVSTTQPVNNVTQAINVTSGKEEPKETNVTVTEVPKTTQETEVTTVERIPEGITAETQSAGEEDENTQSTTDAAAVTTTTEQETHTPTVETNFETEDAGTHVYINTSVVSSEAVNLTSSSSKKSSSEKENDDDGEEETTEKSQIVTTSTETHPRPIKANFIILVFRESWHHSTHGMRLYPVGGRHRLNHLLCTTYWLS